MILYVRARLAVADPIVESGAARLVRDIALGRGVDVVEVVEGGRGLVDDGVIDGEALAGDLDAGAQYLASEFAFVATERVLLESDGAWNACCRGLLQRGVKNASTVSFSSRKESAPDRLGQILLRQESMVVTLLLGARIRHVAAAPDAE